MRQGKYTKRISRVELVRRGIKRRWTNFRLLSKKKQALIVFGPIAAVMILIPIGTYIYYAHDISDQERLMNRSNTGIVLNDRNGETFYSTGRAEKRQMIPLDQISDSTEQALIASEDKNFYKHSGFSILDIFKALMRNITNRDATAYGGSTITQQLAKNTLLTSNQTLLRKYQELVISVAIERRYEKDEILSMYLNSVYYGNDSFGIQEAAQNYFGKSASELDLAESAALIGMLPAPTAYSPITGSEELTRRQQETVLKRMVDNGYITDDERQAALGVELAYQAAQSEIDNAAPHFTEMVIEELYEEYGEERVKRSGYQVNTSLDLALQRTANATITRQMSHIQSQGGSNAGMIAIDPKTGEIRALVGSSDWSNENWGKVNMATTARQPGSTFKAIYYADALAKGVITPATIFEDKAINIDGYQPKNATRQYYGKITVRNALARSLNIPSVLIMQKYGVAKSVAAAERMGIKALEDPDKYGLSLAIGSAEVPLIQMTNAYAAFGNAGQQNDTTTLHTIEDKFGKTIFTHRAQPKEVISEEGAYLISDILADNNARASMFGGALTIPGKTVAVKTGTTDDSRDAWTIGYTPDIAVGAWVGNNNNEIMYSGGADMAGPIWRGVITQAIGSSKPSFSQPAGVTKVQICSDGRRATRSGQGVRQEVFLSSALPTGNCTPDQAPRVEEKPPEEEPEEEPVVEEKPRVEEPKPVESEPTDETEQPTTSPSPTPTSPTPSPTPTSPSTGSQPTNPQSSTGTGTAQ